MYELKEPIRISGSALFFQLTLLFLPPLASAGVERSIREICREVERSELERPRSDCGTEVPAQRAEALGRVFLLTLLPRSKRVRRRAGPQPRDLDPKL